MYLELCTWFRNKALSTKGKVLSVWLDLLHFLVFTYDPLNPSQHWSFTMSDRKYRQRGYMDSDREPQRPKPQPGPQGQSRPHDREGPRSPKMMAFGESVKCSNCGTQAPTTINLATSCSKCNGDLHTCRQCTHFDPSAHFECSAKITKRIVNKNARNLCELFAPRTVVERQTSSGAPTDARAAFAKLFKK